VRRSLQRSAAGWLAVVFAVVLLGLPAGPVAPGEVRAATPDLTIVSTARYEVQPGDRRVRVTIDLTLTNRLKDTKTKRFYFNEAFLAVIPGASGFKLTTSGKGSPSVRVTKRARTHTLLRLGLASRLFSGKTAKYRLRYDLNDPGGSPTRELRVGDALVSFPVWAYATEGTAGSSVSVAFPKGYEPRVEAGDLGTPVTDAEGRITFSSGKLSKPLEFFGYLIADRPGAYTDEPITPTVLGAPAPLNIRGWTDDRPWADRVGGLLERALPVMGEKIGLAWPRDVPLTVQESVSRSTGGYAGLFDPSANRVEVAYYASDFVVLHEAAHGWFNGALLADRWANEAFASYYAGVAAADLGVEVTPAAPPARPSDPARIALNAWVPLGATSTATEDYGYAASLAVAQAIAQRAGPDLRDVWAAVAARAGAYQPPSGPDEGTVASAPDWRGLLDLLEDRTGKPFDDLWRTWIARPGDLAALDARTSARAAYDKVFAATDGWQLPRAIRDAMRAWRFEDATSLLDGAGQALRDRAAIDAAASAAGLTVPATMRTAFEDDDGFDDTAAEAAAELETIARYRTGAAAAPAEMTPITELGLLDATPEADLAAARDAFARGDLTASVRASDRAAATWAGAATIGQGRAMQIGLGAVSAVLVLILLVALVVRYRRRRVSSVVAEESRPAER